jgi:phage gp36-like protein
MIYATPEDFMRILSRTEAGELSQIDETSDIADVEKIQDALRRASLDIDSELALMGYRFPLPADVLISQLTDICVYLAWEKMNIYGDIRETVSRLSDNARERLKRIRLFNSGGIPIDLNVTPVDGGRYVAPSYVSDRANSTPPVTYDRQDPYGYFYY